MQSSFAVASGRYQSRRRKFPDVNVVGKKEVVDFAKINDNFCDCEDGSDEPGTNACNHVKDAHGFYCQNVGSEPKLIKNSFSSTITCATVATVQTRNSTQKKHCQNTCYRDGKETMESLRKDAERFRERNTKETKRVREDDGKSKERRGEGSRAIGKIRQTVERRKAKETGGRGEGERTVSRKGGLKEERDEEEKEETRGGRKTESFLYSSSNDESKEEREMREMEEEMREIEREGEVDRAGAKIAARREQRRRRSRKGETIEKKRTRREVDGLPSN